MFLKEKPEPLNISENVNLLNEKSPSKELLNKKQSVVRIE